MTYLLDTNVVSEWVKTRPEPRVAAWLSHVDEDETYLSVVVLTEIRYGIERLADGARKRALDRWLREALPNRFYGRVLAVDDEIADACGRLMAHRTRSGRPLGPMDGFLVSTALVHDMTLVTRNVADFATCGAKIHNPWREA